MQHFGDLQPLGRPDILPGQSPIGSYSARRSRWRFAVGSLEVGFDRASEEIHAEPRPAPPAAAPRPDFGTRLMILVGMLGSVALVVGGAGWLWSSRAALASGESVSASIVEREAAFTKGPLTPAAGAPTVIPTKRPPSRLSAVIEQRTPAPAAAPAPRASLPIAQGAAIAPREPDENRFAPTPDEAIVSSGNFLLIPSVASAVAQAMTDGEAQNWVAGRYHGVVVVGPGDVRDGKTCRQGTVLLRDGTTQGRTQRFERCS